MANQKIGDKKMDLDYGPRVSHLKSGYENSQSVVRFIDTKIGALLAGITALSGLTLGYTKTVLEALPEFSSNIETWGGMWCSVLFWLVISGITLSTTVAYVFWHSKQTLIPRDTGGSKASVIFPYLDLNNPDIHRTGKERIAIFREGGTQSQAIEDWANQLERMGEINCEKLQHCKKAFQGGFVSLIAFAVYFTFCLLVAYASQ